MKKISHSGAQALLKEAGAAIRELVGETTKLKEKVSHYERENRIRKIAMDMESKKLQSELSFEQKVAALRGAKSLDVAEEAVKLASPQGFGFAELSDNPGATNAQSALETFIMTGEAPEE